MPYTLVSNATTAAATLVWVADNGLTNIVGGAAVTQTGTMPSSTVGGHAALGVGAASDNYLSAAMGGTVGAGVPYAVMIVGEFGDSSEGAKSVIAYNAVSAAKPQIYGENVPPRKVSACSAYVGFNYIGAVSGGAWIGSGEQIIICGRNAANKMAGSLNGAATVVNNYTDASLANATLNSAHIIKFAGSPVTDSGKTGLAGFAASMFAVFVNVTPEALNAYIGTNPWTSLFVTGATATTLSGPSSGTTGVASTNFTVGANGTITGTVTVTPSDAANGGTFTPTTVAISSGTPTATFTYTPASTGVKTISISDDGGLTDATSLSYTSNSLTQTLTPSLFTNTSTFYVPTVAAGAVALTPSLFTNTNAFYSATVSLAGGAQTLTPSLFSNSNTFYGPTVVRTPGFLTPVMKNNTGAVWATETGITCNVYNQSTGALVLHKTGLTADANGVVSVTDNAMVEGTTYDYNIKLGTAQRLPTAVA